MIRSHLIVSLLGLGMQRPARMSYLVGATSDTTRPLEIENPMFDEPYYLQGGVHELKLADYWLGRWVHGANADEGFLVRPEFYQKGLGPVWNPMADVCQGVQSTWATHEAAVVQKVDLPLGAKNIRVEAEVAYYAPKSGMAAAIGLDGTGQTESIEAETIRWSGTWLDQDRGWSPETWTVLATEMEQAESGQISIWLKSWNRWRARNNHVYWRRVLGVCKTPPSSPGPGPEPPGEDASLETLIEYMYSMLDLQRATLEQMEESLQAVRPEIIHEEHYKRLRGEADG